MSYGALSTHCSPGPVSGLPDRFMSLGMDGPWMSASSSPIDKDRSEARAAARFTAHHCQTQLLTLAAPLQGTWTTTGLQTLLLYLLWWTCPLHLWQRTLLQNALYPGYRWWPADVIADRWPAACRSIEPTYELACSARISPHVIV